MAIRHVSGRSASVVPPPDTMTSDLSQTATSKRDAFLLQLRESSAASFERLRAASPDEAETFDRVERAYIERKRSKTVGGGAGFDDSGFAHSVAEAKRTEATRGGDGSTCPPKQSEAAARGAAELVELPPTIAAVFVPSMDELRAAAGYKNPGARALEMRAERDERDRERRDQARQLEAARSVIREQLGDWTKDERKRLEQMQPIGEDEIRDAKRLGKRIWAISRQTSTGSARDLAYAIEQMLTCAPVAAVGCWIVEAMGMREDGKALRQLYSPKARRKLVRSFVLWMAGDNCRLKYIAGSPSMRWVRGVKRVPQRLLARIAGVGGGVWSRSTVTRDANEAHEAGLYRRVRLPVALAHESERCGKSGQVVSRYWMELPKQPQRKSRFALPEPVGSSLAGKCLADDPLAWVSEHAKNAIVYAMHAVTTVRRGVAGLVTVPGMLAPLLHAPS
jgi:hypothetical protein